MAGHNERGRKTSAGARLNIQREERGAETPAPTTRRRMRAINAPGGSSADSRATNLIPRVRPDEHGPISRPRTRNTAAPHLTNIP
ncbi:MAG TPA: hypothetical protein VJR48_01705, partial [Ktedonobacterales bacterium]|nr:hypothetical protein [Ktedonobacterales bacterium]